MNAGVDTSLAEQWLDDSKFLYQGKIYEINFKGEIQELPDFRHLPTWALSIMPTEKEV
jgi:hypothetical protein